MSLKSKLISHAHALLDRVFPEPVTARQHLRQNLIIGLLVVVVVVVFQGAEFVRHSRENSLDWLMRMHRGLAFDNAKEFRPFVFYDIDDKSMELWGEPLFTPREKLATLIGAALAQLPGVLIVDVELSRSTTEDAQLLGVLAAHARNLDAPTMILVPNFKWNEDVSDERHLIARLSFIERALPSSKNRMWANPLFEQDRDGQFRRWRIWQPACSSEGVPMLVPSVQVATLAALAGTEGRTNLDQALQAATPASCNGVMTKLSTNLTLGDRQIEVTENTFAQRILFSFPWKLGEGETRPEVVLDGRNTRLLTIIPAHAVTEGGLKLTFPAGHIAVIGASNQDARDNHFTPLGAMPGSLILINAIHSLIQYGQMTTPPPWMQLLTATCLLVAVSLIFVRFPSMLGTVISLVVLVALLVPLSMYLFRFGIWLDFALPIVAIKCFQLSMEYLRRHSANRKLAKSG